jgi:hypothetical protein
VTANVTDRPSRLIVTSLLHTATVVGGLLVAYSFVPLRGRLWWVGAILGVGALAAVVPFAVRRVRRVLVSDHPVIAAAEAVILIAALIVTAFAGIYYGVADLSGQFVGLKTRIDSMYFTIVTLATVGFGDVSASGQASRVIVTLQILVNLAFFGAVVRVFTAAAQRRIPERYPGPGAGAAPTEVDGDPPGS